jgi:hypothetical protein
MSFAAETARLVAPVDYIYPEETGPDHTESLAKLIVELLQVALASPDIPSAVTPILQALVDRTEAVGSAYFQVGGALVYARAAAGEMPTGPIMDAILAHGLPADTALMVAVGNADKPLFYDDTRASDDTVGFPDLGVASIAAAPVRSASGSLTGAFLMHTFRPHSWSDDESDLLGMIASTLANLTGRLVAEEQAIQARENALRAVGLAAERRDGETKYHTDRVVGLATKVARQMQVDETLLAEVRWGSYLHDVGKISIPDRILHKPGKLDDSEWNVMRRHAEYGHEFACTLGFLPGGTLDLILCHHERWAGGGYPNGISGDEIPLPARIFAVCDVYDALVSERPYKPAWTHEAAVQEIISQTGKHFDPAVVDAFVEVMSLKTDAAQD